MSAIERAEQDVERGDYGLARVRLADYLNSKGYDAGILDRLGRISYEMHDLSQAGRYWLASTAEGPHVEDTVAAFVGRTGTDPRVTVSRLPRVVREAPMSALPSIAKDRLRRLGLDEALGKWCPGQPPVGAKPLGRIARATIALVFLALVIVLCIVVCTGLWTISNWLFE
jgi:hypothetical protein